jgi:hypothetical protein
MSIQPKVPGRWSTGGEWKDDSAPRGREWSINYISGQMRSENGHWMICVEVMVTLIRAGEGKWAQTPD